MTAPLPHRPLGQTGLNVSPLGLGTVKLGRNEGVKYPRGFTLPDDREARALIALARELGINLIDTAPAYGTSESRLGPLLQGQRDDWVLCTKVGEEFENGQSRFDFSPAHIRRSVERSLQRLRTDCLDIVLVHSSGEDRRIIEQDGALETLAALKQEGKIRATGMSTKTVDGGLLAAARADVVMATYHPDWTEEAPVLDYCHEHGVGCLIKKAFASGHRLQQTDGDPVADSLRFVLGHPGVGSIIIGTINPDHLRQNAETAARLLAEG